MHHRYVHILICSVSSVRVVILDLLAERAEFGHGGNLEMLAPLIMHFGTVEAWLLTPQFQSVEVGEKQSLEEQISLLQEQDVPYWDDEYPFVPKRIVEFAGGTVSLSRIIMPTSTTTEFANWLISNDISAVFCSGSRRNVSIWESWMDPASDLIIGTILAKLPFLQ